MNDDAYILCRNIETELSYYVDYVDKSIEIRICKYAVKHLVSTYLIRKICFDKSVCLTVFKIRL
jgi:hypothetical protein